MGNHAFNVLQMSICLHYRSYQVLTPHLASPDSGTRLSWGLINHIQACLYPSLLVLLACLHRILCRWPPIDLEHYGPQCLMSTWLSLLRLRRDSVWLLYDYVSSVSCNITIVIVKQCLYATFFCCTIVISVIGSLGLLTVILNNRHFSFPWSFI